MPMEIPGSEEVTRQSFFDGHGNDVYNKQMQRSEFDYRTKLAVNYYLLQKSTMPIEKIAAELTMDADSLAALLGEVESTLQNAIEDREQGRQRYEAMTAPVRMRDPVPPPSPVDPIDDCYDLSPAEKDMFTGTTKERNAAKSMYCARCLGKEACLDLAVKVVTLDDKQSVYGGLSGRALINYVEKARATESAA